MVMPPAGRTAAQRTAYIKQLTTDHPWITSSGRANVQYILPFLEQEVRLLEDLNQDPAFVKEAANRPDLVNFRLRSFHEVEAQKYSLSKKATKALALDSEVDMESLKDDLMNRLQAIEQNPLNSILVGVLRSFPKELGQAGFKIPDVRQKVEYVQKNLKKLSDEQMRGEFQGARYGLKGDKWGTADIANLIEQSLQSSKELFEQSIRYIAALRAQKTEGQELAFDRSEEITAEIQSVLDESLDRKTNWKLVGQEFNIWVDQYFVLQKTTIRAPQYEVILEEIPPYVATFRSSITGDCSTGASAFYPYSPFERNFLIRHNGQVVAHTSGTYVRVGKERVFYLHDLRGLATDPHLLDLVLVSMLEHTDMFGVRRVLLATQKKRGSIHWGSQLVNEVSMARGAEAITYYPADRKIRATIGNYVNYGQQYDSPEGNPDAISPRSGFPAGDIGPTEVTVVDSVDPDAGLDPATRSLQRLGVLLAGGALSSKVPEEEAKALNEAARQLINPRKLPLNDYYAMCAEALKAVGLNLSNKFFKENPSLFERGHFAARDVYQTEDDEAQKRSYQVLYGIIYRAPEVAAGIMKRFGEEWLHGTAIRRLLQQMLEERGAQGIARFVTLVNNGVPAIGAVADSAAARQVIFNSGNASMIFELMTILKAKEYYDYSEQQWDQIAILLDNEDKNVEEKWALLAAELFAGAEQVPATETVRKQLRASVKHEANKRILTLTSIAYLRFGIEDLEAASESELKAYHRAATHLGKMRRPTYVAAKQWQAALDAIDETVVERAAKEIKKSKKKKKTDEGEECAPSVAARGRKG